MTENAKTIKSICASHGISKTELSRRFDIPLRTVQDWFGEKRNPPRYVVNMISALLEYEAKK